MTDRESLVLCSYYLDNPALRRFHAIIRPEQFQEPGTSMLFTVLQKYHQEYGRMPTHQEAEMEVRDYRGPKQHEEDSALELLGRYEAERGAAAPEPQRHARLRSVPVIRGQSPPHVAWGRDNHALPSRLPGGWACAHTPGGIFVAP